MPKSAFYQVEKILARRVNQKTNQVEYKIKWVGYSTEESTWEPLSSVQFIPELVQEFENKINSKSKIREEETQNSELKKQLSQQFALEHKITQESHKQEKRFGQKEWRFFSSKLILHYISLIEGLVKNKLTDESSELKSIRKELKYIGQQILKNKLNNLQNLQLKIFLTQIKIKQSSKQIKIDKSTKKIIEQKKFNEEQENITDDSEIEVVPKKSSKKEFKSKQNRKQTIFPMKKGIRKMKSKSQV